MLSREVETEILPLCGELKISFIAFSPLGRGLLANKLKTSDLEETDFRKSLPRYQETYAENNRQLSEELSTLAESIGYTPVQLALAWLLDREANIIPISGTKKRKYLIENAGAVDLVLNGEILPKVENLLLKYPDTGARYNDTHLRLIGKN